MESSRRQRRAAGDSRQATAGGRIAIFLPSLAAGGAERVMLNLASGLSGRQIPVDLVLAKAKGEYLTQVAAGVRVVDLGCDRVIASLPGLVRYLRRERPAILLSAIEHANLVALWAKLLAGGRTRTVVSLHTNLQAAVRFERQLKQRFGALCIRAFYRLSDALVAVSRGIAADVGRFSGIAAARIQVIYNPVLTPDLEERAREPLDHPWFRAGEAPVILSVGRLSLQKDWPTLFRAFVPLAREKKARLLVLGEGEERPALEKMLRELGIADSVSLAGYADNPYPYIAHADLLVLSSRAEGLPTILIEALALGTPVVSSDCPSGPAEILDGGRLGVLVPVGDAEGLALAMRHALTEPLRPVGADLGCYRLDFVLDRYLELFAKAANR